MANPKPQSGDAALGPRRREWRGTHWSSGHHLTAALATAAHEQLLGSACWVQLTRLEPQEKSPRKSCDDLLFLALCVHVRPCVLNVCPSLASKASAGSSESSIQGTPKELQATVRTALLYGPRFNLNPRPHAPTI